MSQGVRKIGPKVVMDGLAAATDQAAIIECGDVTSITLLFWWDTGSSLSGEFKVDVLKRAKDVDGALADEWHPIVLSATILVTGTDGNDDAVLSGDVRKIRVRYVATAGTGKVYVSYSATTRG